MFTSLPAYCFTLTWSKLESHDSYAIVIGHQSDQVEDISMVGVKLNDFDCIRVWLTVENKALKRRRLNECWPAEFDMEGMVQGAMSPFGTASVG